MIFLTADLPIHRIHLRHQLMKTSTDDDAEEEEDDDDDEMLGLVHFCFRHCFHSCFGSVVIQSCSFSRTHESEVLVYNSCMCLRTYF